MKDLYSSLFTPSLLVSFKKVCSLSLGCCLPLSFAFHTHTSNLSFVPGWHSSFHFHAIRSILFFFSADVTRWKKGEGFALRRKGRLGLIKEKVFFVLESAKLFLWRLMRTWSVRQEWKKDANKKDVVYNHPLFSPPFSAHSYPLPPLFFFMWKAQMAVIVRRHLLDFCVSLHQHSGAVSVDFWDKGRGHLGSGVMAQSDRCLTSPWFNKTFWWTQIKKRWICPF